MRRGHSRDSSDRIGNGLGRSTLDQADDTHLMQEVQLRLFHGEQQQSIEHAQPYGFTFVPKKPTTESGIRRAAEAFVGFLLGNRSHGVATLVADRRFRPNNLQEGEVALHDDQGQQVYLSRNTVVVNVPKGHSVHVQTGDGGHMVLTPSHARMQLGTASVTVAGGNVYLGQEGAPHQVVTVDGPSNKVFAVIDESESALGNDATAQRTVPQQQQN